jgi:hypothetical protein
MFYVSVGVVISDVGPGVNGRRLNGDAFLTLAISGVGFWKRRGLKPGRMYSRTIGVSMRPFSTRFVFFRGTVGF